jgi:hypothetical protein
MRRRSHWSVLLAALAASGTVAACGGSGAGEGSEAATSPPAEPAPPPAEPPVAAEGDSVTAGLTEFAISLSEPTLEPGTYTFVVENAGGVDHALEIDGAAGEVETDLLAPGESVELSVTLEEGSYELYCPVPGHRDQGMELEIAVGAGATSTEPPTATTGGSDQTDRY